MEKITLLNAPTYAYLVSCTPPLGISIVQRNLRRAGFSTDLKDLATESRILKEWNLNKFDDCLKRRDTAAMQWYSKKMLESVPIGSRRVGISVFCWPQLYPALVLANYLDGLNKEVYLGGNVMGYQPAEDINHFIPKSVRIFKSMEDFFPLKKKGFELEDIPDFSGLSMDAYKVMIKGKWEIILPFLLRRGCNNQCAFCIEDNRKHTLFDSELYARFAAKNIIELSKKYSTRYFFFADCAINNFPESLGLLADNLKGKGIKWGAFACISGMSKPLLKKIRDSGCEFLLYGVESGSPRVLRIMRKAHNPTMAKEVLKLSKEAGIHNFCYFITNFPGETKEDFRLTRRFIIRNRRIIDDIRVNTFMLYKGSHIFNNPREFGIKLGPPLDIGKTSYSFQCGPLSFAEYERISVKRKGELDLLADAILNLRRYLRHPFVSVRRKYFNRSCKEGFPVERRFDLV